MRASRRLLDCCAPGEVSCLPDTGDPPSSRIPTCFRRALLAVSSPSASIKRPSPEWRKSSLEPTPVAGSPVAARASPDGTNGERISGYACTLPSAGARRPLNTGHLTRCAERRWGPGPDRYAAVTPTTVSRRATQSCARLLPAWLPPDFPGPNRYRCAPCYQHVVRRKAHAPVLVLHSNRAGTGTGGLYRVAPSVPKVGCTVVCVGPGGQDCVHNCRENARTCEVANRYNEVR